MEWDAGLLAREAAYRAWLWEASSDGCVHDMHDAHEPVRACDSAVHEAIGRILAMGRGDRRA
jgi:hypothetical protein